MMKIRDSQKRDAGLASIPQQKFSNWSPQSIPRPTTGTYHVQGALKLYAYKGIPSGFSVQLPLDQRSLAGWHHDQPLALDGSVSLPHSCFNSSAYQSPVLTGQTHGAHADSLSGELSTRCPAGPLGPAHTTPVAAFPAHSSAGAHLPWSPRGRLPTSPSPHASHESTVRPAPQEGPHRARP